MILRQTMQTTIVFFTVSTSKSQHPCLLLAFYAPLTILSLYFFTLFLLFVLQLYLLWLLCFLASLFQFLFRIFVFIQRLCWWLLMLRLLFRGEIVLMVFLEAHRTESIKNRMSIHDIAVAAPFWFAGTLRHSLLKLLYHILSISLIILVSNPSFCS